MSFYIGDTGDVMIPATFVALAGEAIRRAVRDQAQRDGHVRHDLDPVLAALAEGARRRRTALNESERRDAALAAANAEITRLLGRDQMPPDSAEFPTAGVASRLRLSVSRVQQLVADGHLQGRKAGLDLWITEASVERFERSRP